MRPDLVNFDGMPVNCPCFQEVVSNALDRSGMGVDELARRLGSRSAVQATGWLHGARVPDDRMINALSNELDIDAFYLRLVSWMDERPAYRPDLALTMQQRGWPIPTAARTSLLKPRPLKHNKKKKPNKISDKPDRGSRSSDTVPSCNTAQRQQGPSMKTYNLTTWATHGLAGYEPIVAPSAEEAVAYAAGMLTERTKHDPGTLARFGVNYRLAEGEIALTELETLEKKSLRAIRAWAINPTAGHLELAPLS